MFCAMFVFLLIKFYGRKKYSGTLRVPNTKWERGRGTEWGEKKEKGREREKKRGRLPATSSVLSNTLVLGSESKAPLI